MSGHSKFSNIRAKKEKNDAAKGKIFTIIGHELALAVKQGERIRTVTQSFVMSLPKLKQTICRTIPFKTELKRLRERWMQ